MKETKEFHPNFKGNWQDLEEFVKLVNSPVRSEERSIALEGWSNYKRNRQFTEYKKQDGRSRLVAKGDHIVAYRRKVVDLSGASLDNITVGYADMQGVKLDGASLRGAWMKGIVFQDASLVDTDFGPIKNEYATRRSRLLEGNFDYCDLSRANLMDSDLSNCSFKNAILKSAHLNGTNLKNAILINTNLVDSNLSNSHIYGISAWDIKKEGALQQSLYINDNVTVDDLEIAQFIYLLLHNNKITSALSAITRKGVLILGRFTPERKEILDAIKKELRNNHDLVPIVFDFERAVERDFTETIKILAGLSRFVIADISEPKSSPLELQATIPNYMVPFIPIIREGERPFSMFVDLWKKYDKWVIKPIEYPSKEKLISNMGWILSKVRETEETLRKYKLQDEIETQKLPD